jgi:hypothetical protein
MHRRNQTGPNTMAESTDFLTRRQFRLFAELGDAIHLTQDDRRRALALSETQWAAWSGTLHDGPLPAEPGVPDMLCRLGVATYTLSCLAEDASRR